MEEEEAQKKPTTHSLGEDLALLSVEELQERIELCQSEIGRLEAELDKKRASLSAADAFFKT